MERAALDKGYKLASPEQERDYLDTGGKTEKLRLSPDGKVELLYFAATPVSWAGTWSTNANVLELDLNNDFGRTIWTYGYRLSSGEPLLGLELLAEKNYGKDRGATITTRPPNERCWDAYRKLGDVVE